MILWIKWLPTSGHTHSGSSWNPHQRLPCASSLSLLWACVRQGRVSGRGWLPLEGPLMREDRCWRRLPGSWSCTNRLNFHVEILVPEPTEALAPLLLLMGLEAYAMKSPGSGPRQSWGWRAHYTLCRGQLFSGMNFLVGKKVGGQREVSLSHEAPLCVLAMIRRCPRSHSSHNHCTCRFCLWTL